MESILPVYHQIKNSIKSWIINREYKAGEKIPSEVKLAEIFKVSRLTVRRAVAMLIQEGLLRSRRGEGTFVTRDEVLINSFGLEFSGFMDDLFYQTSESTTKSVEISRAVPPEMIAEKLGIEDKTQEVVVIKRVRLLRGKTFAYTINYLPPDIGDRITEQDLYRGPMLRLLEQELGVVFSEAFQTIEASFCDGAIAEKLGVSAGSPILFVERTMYNLQGRPVEVVQSSYRGDIYKYVVRLKMSKGKHGSVWVHRGAEPSGAPETDSA
ncbi:MAG: GntR family transcriptional regulator [Deltaproteobacteria bacterium]|nr:GntR family transcriptional regulator [Deltaproteobacteria bacterium]